MLSANHILDFVKTNSINSGTANERTQAILEIAIRDFIKNGRPITSQVLYEEHDFGIKPATIRLELNTLSDSGYFYQTHPSGGRFPTNKAFRFFAEATSSRSEDRIAENMLTLAREFIDDERGSFIEELASQFKVAGVGYDSFGTYTSTLSELLSRVEAREKDELVDVVEDCELLPERLRGIFGKMSDDAWPFIFIGRGPLARSDHVSVIAGSFPTKNGEFTLAIIGPKRMDYEKPISFFRSMKKASNVKNNHKNHERRGEK